MMNNRPMFTPPSSPIISPDRSPDMMDVHYLNELLNDRALLDSLPKRFMHVQRILDQEIVNVRQRLFDNSTGVVLMLPEPIGEPRLHRKKLYIPENTGCHFNYVGRLLGPRGKTLKGIEQDTGCKIMIRGVGSSRPTTPSSAGGVFFGGPTYNRNFSVNGYSSPQYSSPQHFGGENDHLHVVIQCDDTPNRAEIRINTALSLIDALFAPVDESCDTLKQKQLLELSILRGTFKPSSSPPQRPESDSYDCSTTYWNFF